MNTEVRTVRYDAQLQIEAYHFLGVMQEFPNHFHEYYVVGFIERGKRWLCCKGKTYTVEAGDLLLFNPKDSHTCRQVDNRALDYRCLNIPIEAMGRMAREITGREDLPYFTQPVVFRSELAPSLREVHARVMREENDFRKEELLLFLLEQLIAEYAGQPEEPGGQALAGEVEAVCAYLERHYAESITLDQLSQVAGLSKYYLLRSFTKQKGISPYRYLETVRISRAKELLEQGVLPLDAALRTGFADQSHFSNFFKKFIGLTPRQYGAIFAKGREKRPASGGIPSHEA